MENSKRLCPFFTFIYNTFQSDTKKKEQKRRREMAKTDGGAAVGTIFKSWEERVRIIIYYIHECFINRRVCLFFKAELCLNIFKNLGSLKERTFFSPIFVCCRVVKLMVVGTGSILCWTYNNILL